MPPSASGVAPLPPVAISAYTRLPLLRFVFRRLGIVWNLAREKSPQSMLALATLAGVVPSWRHCHGHYLGPSSSNRGNPRSGFPDRTTGASCVVLLPQGVVLFARSILSADFGDVGHLVIGRIVSLVGEFSCVFLWVVCLMSLWFGEPCVRAMCCITFCTHSISPINAKIRKLCVFPKKYQSSKYTKRLA